MRVLFLICAVACAGPSVSAQTDGASRPAQADDAEDAPRVPRWVIRRDTMLEDRTVEVRLDSLGARLGGLFGSAGPLGTRMRRFEIELDGEAPAVRFQTTDDGVDPGVRDRVRRLEQETQRLAEAQRTDPSRSDERALDEALAELFELRGTLRRQRAAALRARADALQDEANVLEREVQRRETDRATVIAARKRELLDRGATSDW